MMKKLLAILFILFTIGCQTYPELDVPTEKTTIVPMTYEITIRNARENWYTVRIGVSKDGNSKERFIIYPNEIKVVYLEMGTYKVCLSKEFDIEEVCFDKIVNDDREWIIRTQK